jgi:tryptophan synthase
MQLKEACRGLTVPVLLMGEQTLQHSSAVYDNLDGFILAICQYWDASEAGAIGFSMVDLPLEEAITFRQKCANAKSLFPSMTMNLY